MHQFEYTDLNKFYVSVGISLPIAAFTLLWFFSFSESSDLLITTEELKNLTVVAQSVIHQRQTYISYLPRITLFISIFSFFAGLFFIKKGINGWIKSEKLNKKTNQQKNKRDYNHRSSLRKIMYNNTSIQKIKLVPTRTSNYNLEVTRKRKPINASASSCRIQTKKNLKP